MTVKEILKDQSKGMRKEIKKLLKQGYKIVFYTGYSVELERAGDTVRLNDFRLNQV